MIRRKTHPIEAIWEAIENGDGDRALKIARTLRPSPEDHDANLAIGAAHLEVGEFEIAREILTGLAEAGLAADPEYLRRWYLAQTEFSLGEPEVAFDLFSTLEPATSVENANLHWWLGLCHDHLEETERADECFRKAIALDPAGAPRPVTMSADEVEQLVKEVAERLPEELRATLEEVPVVVQDLPPLDVVRKSKGQVHPDTLGLYLGQNLMERSHLGISTLAPAIYIFRRNLERFARDRDEARREIEITLLHELGHHLGYDEDDLDQLGLG